jgi:SAM-dependent methyltransferase
MTRQPFDPGLYRQTVTSLIQGDDFRKATFGGAKRGNASVPWVRVVIRPVELRGQGWLQFSYFDATKDITKNFRGADVALRIDELIDAGFAGIHVTTNTEEIDLRLTKKGSLQIGRKEIIAGNGVRQLAHNRTKDVLLPEGRADRLLEVMGILTRDGRVKPTMRAKFNQINEFLKHLAHTIDETELRRFERPVEILDCGCGSSYLTLAVHHYLNDIREIPARIMGVDVNEEVIRKSVARSERLGAKGLSFTCGRIGASPAKADIVLALHACDTATDDAIAKAIAGEAVAILSVPCCHHDLNDKLRAEGPASALRPLFRHGILMQRTADVITDAFRALVLRIMGYKTDVVEFIGTEHTPRNLMIRAIRGAPQGDPLFIREYYELRRFLNVTPYLETILGEPFQRSLMLAAENHLP